MYQRFLAFGVAAGLLLSLTACGTVQEGEKQTSGDSVTVSGTAQGFAGEVTVTLTMKDGVIEKATAEGPGESPDVGGVAMQSMTEAMVEQNTIDVDAISEATSTSEAVLAAAADAMNQLN